MDSEKASSTVRLMLPSTGQRLDDFSPPSNAVNLTFSHYAQK